MSVSISCNRMNRISRMENHNQMIESIGGRQESGRGERKEAVKAGNRKKANGATAL